MSASLTLPSFSSGQTVFCISAFGSAGGSAVSLASSLPGAHVSVSELRVFINSYIALVRITSVCQYFGILEAYL